VHPPASQIRSIAEVGWARLRGMDALEALMTTRALRRFTDEPVADAAERIVRMKDGRVVDDGTTALSDEAAMPLGADG